MTAVVTLKEGQQGRHYRLPTDADYAAVRLAQDRVEIALSEWEREGKHGICPVPDEPLPPVGTLGFRVQRYGMTQWGDLFTARQKAALVYTTKSIGGHRAPALRSLMAMVGGRCADYGSSGVVWAQQGEFVAHTFGRQALPIVWDFAECVLWTDSSGNMEGATDWVARVIESSSSRSSGQIEQADAGNHPLPNQSAGVWFTDPPYYDAVPYADLSDFFLVWHKRTVPEVPYFRDPTDAANLLSPKAREIVQDETKVSNGSRKDRKWFETSMASAFAEGRRGFK